MEQFFVDVATKLGLEAARVWPQAVMITFVNALFWLVTNVVVVIVGIATIYPAWHKLIKFLKRCNWYDNEKDTLMLVAIIITAVVVLVVGGSFVSIPQNLSAVLYPEAATVMQLLGK